MSSKVAQENFDPDFLRQKYAEERAKRLRPDGNRQYQAMRGEFSYFLEDPYLAEPIARDPLEDQVGQGAGAEGAAPTECTGAASRI